MSHSITSKSHKENWAPEKKLNRSNNFPKKGMIGVIKIIQTSGNLVGLLYNLRAMNFLRCVMVVKAEHLKYWRFSGFI